MKLIFVYLFCLAFAGSTPHENWYEANQAYDKGDYDTAIQTYHALLNSGIESSDLYFNLANGYFKKGNLGLSIYYFRKAHALSPRDPDTQFNLNYAREKASDQIESKESLGSKVVKFFFSVSEKEAYLLSLAAIILLFGSATLFLFFKQDWLRICRNGLMGITVFALISLLVHLFLREPFGVVVASEAKVFSGIGRDNVVLFTLHEGSEFVVNDSHEGGDWVRIKLADGKQGWLRSADIVHEKV